MAKLYGILSKMRGSIGNVTYAQLNGETVAKEKVIKKDNPVRTKAQMELRTSWANIIAMWGTFNNNMKPSFETKPRTSSDYNMFVSANANVVKVFLTSAEARNGGCVVAPYQITRGSLPSIGVTVGEGNNFVSDIAVGGLALGASTLLKTFSKAIIDNSNGAWENGDQLSVFISRQTVDSNTGVPHVKTECIEITLDKYNDIALLGDMIDVNLFTVADGYLALANEVNGGVAWVHSRKTVSKTLVSTQFIVVSNPLLASYTSEASMENAIESYGGVRADQFLTPNVDQLVPAA